MVQVTKRNWYYPYSVKVYTAWIIRRKLLPEYLRNREGFFKFANHIGKPPTPEHVLVNLSTDGRPLTLSHLRWEERWVSMKRINPNEQSRKVKQHKSIKLGY